MKNWKKLVLDKAEAWLGHNQAPLFYKELAWQAVRFVSKCGRSNPVSFALRPILIHRSWRPLVGISLALVVAVASLVGPLPSLAENTGGVVSFAVAPEGEVRLATQGSVNLPLDTFNLTQKFWFLHTGVDLAAPVGTKIRPIMAGRIVKTEKGWFGYGNMVVVAHSAEYQSLYAHLSKISVQEGQEVSIDTVLGEVGSTGRSTGPHLHLEIHENGKQIDPGQVLEFGKN